MQEKKTSILDILSLALALVSWLLPDISLAQKIFIALMLFSSALIMRRTNSVSPNRKSIEEQRRLESKEIAEGLSTEPSIIEVTVAVWGTITVIAWFTSPLFFENNLAFLIKWKSYIYLWSLIPVFIGLGFTLIGWMSRNRMHVFHGRVYIITGVVSFLVTYFGFWISI